jgi:hypothetical protein
MPKVYIETSVVSYLTSQPSRDIVLAAHQQITHSWWATRARFDLYVSEAVLTEAGGGDPVAASRRLAILASLPVLSITNDVVGLATHFIEEDVELASAGLDDFGAMLDHEDAG